MAGLQDRLALALREAREHAGLSQRALAAKLGTNQTRISFTEAGDQHLRVVDLVAWCEAVGADPVEVLRRAMEG